MDLNTFDFAEFNRKLNDDTITANGCLGVAKFGMMPSYVLSANYDLPLRVLHTVGDEGADDLKGALELAAKAYDGLKLEMKIPCDKTVKELRRDNDKMTIYVTSFDGDEGVFCYAEGLAACVLAAIMKGAEASDGVGDDTDEEFDGDED